MHRLKPTLSATDQDWLANTIARNRARFGGWRMDGSGAGDGSGSGDGSGDGSGAGDGKTFTQADVDAAIDKAAARIRADERRKVSEKYADYDDLKTKAEGAKTLEDRIADLEGKGTQFELRALRAEIAGEFGISTKKGPKGEASDAELLLNGTDEEAMRKQAERLAGREAERKKNGNHVPSEGNNPKPGEDETRDFVRGLFDRANSD